MNSSRMISLLTQRFTDRITTIDSHTAGEPTRLVVGGIGALPGAAISDKLEYFKANLDGLRLRLTREPRGHRDMVAAVVTEPVNPDSHFGLFYMDARRYPHLCGHATIGAVTTLIAAGALPVEGQTANICVDTPSGSITARVEMDGQQVVSVGIRMVPAFVYSENQRLDVPGFGRLPVDLVCVGGFFAMVDARRAGIEMTADRRSHLIGLGMAIISAANRQLKVSHPDRPDVRTVDVTEFYETPAAGNGRGRSVVVYGESHMDRSPCGTGTTAKMALLHRRGQLTIGQPYLNESPLGTVFHGRLVKETRVGNLPAVVAEIRGSAQITGMHTFVLDPNDPFPEGFLL